MNKIIKKAMGLIVVMVMLVSLAPMTAKAEDDISISSELEGVSYINKTPSVSLETYTFIGDVDDLIGVMQPYSYGEIAVAHDSKGNLRVVVDSADVKDGEYIGDKPIDDCPRIYMSLNDSTFSFENAISQGDVKYVKYDKEGNPVEVTYYNDMIADYLACADTEVKLYPMTEDLAEILVMVGRELGWYKEGGLVYEKYKEDNITERYLQQFALYYLDQDNYTLSNEENVVDKEIMMDIIAGNEEKQTVINTTAKNDADEEVKVVFTFDKGTMSLVDNKEEYAFGVSLVGAYDKAELDNVEIQKDTFAYKVSFEYDGHLPGEAKIYVPVSSTYANTTLYYYQILEDGTLEFVCEAPVDKACNAKVVQDHCSDYVLLTEKIVEEVPKEEAPKEETPKEEIPNVEDPEVEIPEETPEEEVPKTDDATEFGFWIAVLGLGVVAMVGSVVMKKNYTCKI